MGGDFDYQNARQFFHSIDKLIPYFNNKYAGNMTLMYSTPSEYVDAVNGMNIKWPVNYDDMMPYADDENSYWTGFYSSRANDKEYARRMSSNVHAANKLYAYKFIDQATPEQELHQISEVNTNIYDTLGVN